MLSYIDVKNIISRCHFAMFPNWFIHVGKDDDRTYIQVKCNAGKCNVTGKLLDWSGRKWLISPFMTESELVQTAFKSILTAIEHEVRENFLYRPEDKATPLPIFDPHYDVNALYEIRAQEKLSVRE